MKKKIGKKVVSTLLAGMIIASTTAVATTSANAGLIADLAPSGLASGVMSMVEGAVVFGITQAANSSDDQAFVQALQLTNQLIEGHQKTVNKQLLKQTEEISQQLEALYSFTSSSFDRMDDQLKELHDYNVKHDYTIDRQVLRDFKEDTYEPMLNAYIAFYDAFNAYGENPTDANQSNLIDKYYNIMHYVNDSTMQNQFDDNLTDFLQLISPYDSNYDTNNPNMSDNCDEWGTNGGFETYLYHLYNYIITQTSFENNVYDYMKLGINEVASLSYMYTQSYRYYVQVKALSINSDSSISSAEAKKQIDKLWSDFELANKKLQRGLNQMCSLYENEMNSYMRTYDTLAKVKLRDYKSEQKITEAYKGYNNVDFTLCSTWTNFTKQYDKKFKSDIITPEQYFYQFKLVGENNNDVYAIRNSNSTDSNNSATKSNRSFKYQDTVEYNIMINEETCFSLDFLNLTKGTYSPANFNMISSQSQINPITQEKAYTDSDNLIKNLRKELGLIYDNVYLPDLANKAESSDSDKLDDGSFLLMNTDIDWDCDCGDWSSDDADMKWLNVSMPINANKNHEIEIDCEDDIYDNSDKSGDSLRDKEAYVMLKGAPKMALKVSANESTGSGDAFVTSGSKTVSKNSSAVMNSGDVMTLKVKPDKGSTIESIVIKNQFGETLDVLLDSKKDSNGNVTLSSQEILASRTTDNDGYYEFILPIPCQDATFEVNFTKEDPTLYTYNVTLNSNGTNSLMQFTSYDLISTQHHKSGDVVSVSVIPDNGKLCSGITITDANGNVKNIDVTESTGKKLKPNERIFSFTMPNYDITITPTISNGNIVNIDNDSNSVHRFTNLNCINLLGDNATSWEKSTSMTYKEGDTVTVDITANTGYFVSEIDVYTNSKQIPIVKTNGTEISFTMPKEDVNISVTTQRDSSDNHKATINFNGPENSDVDFVNSSMKKLNVSSLQYKTGDTIGFVVTNAVPSTIKVTDVNGNNLNVKVSKNTDVSGLSNNEHFFELTMPQSNEIIINIDCM